MKISPTTSIFDNHSVETLLTNPESFNDIKQEELLSLLDTLKRHAQLLDSSPHKVSLDHAIHICQSFLNNQLEIGWHQHLYEQAKSQNKGLGKQLTLALTLLDLSNVSQHLADAIDHCAEEHSLFTSNTPACTQAHSSHSVPHDNDQYVAKLDVHFFGTFRVYSDGKLIDCLSKNRAKQLLKYLILNRTKSIPKEVLMDRFWPDYDQNSARNNLNVAVYCLRQTLKNEHSDFVHILFQNGCYFINHNLEIQVDTEMFEQHIKTAERLMIQGKTAEAITEYTYAEAIYQGEFLAEDLYEDWSLELREYYKFLYVKLLGKLSDFYYQQQALQDCIAVNRKITAIEIGDEHAHRRLMDCFARLNQRHLALRQYQLCTEALAKEFDLKPSQETVALYKSIKAQDVCEQDSKELYRGIHLKQA